MVQFLWYNAENNDNMIKAPKAGSHFELARKWGLDFDGAPQISKKWGRGPMICECVGEL